MRSFNVKLRVLTVHLPEAYINGLDQLVNLRFYPSRSEVIRVAVRDLLKRELWSRQIEELEALKMFG